MADILTRFHEAEREDPPLADLAQRVFEDRTGGIEQYGMGVAEAVDNLVEDRTAELAQQVVALEERIKRLESALARMANALSGINPNRTEYNDTNDNDPLTLSGELPPF